MAGHLENDAIFRLTVGLLAILGLTLGIGLLGRVVLRNDVGACWTASPWSRRVRVHAFPDIDVTRWIPCLGGRIGGQVLCESGGRCGHARDPSLLSLQWVRGTKILGLQFWGDRLHVLFHGSLEYRIKYLSLLRGC